MDNQNNNITTVYKVVRAQTAGAIYVSYTYAMPSNYVVTYAIGKKSLPIGKSYLYAFVDLDNAKEFWRANKASMSSARILECKAVTVSNLLPVICYCIEKFDVFWNILNNNDIDSLSAPNCLVAPLGTIFCKWIKPIKLVL